MNLTHIAGSRIVNTFAAAMATLLSMGSSPGVALAQMYPMPEPLIINPLVPPRPSPDHGAYVRSIDAAIEINDRLATTTLTITIVNSRTQHHTRPAEAVIMLPVPDGATIRAMTFDGAGAEPNAEVLPRDKAREIYDRIVSSMRDPALLEFVGYSMIRTSVFPVPPGGSRTVTITYEQLLTADVGRLDYTLLRSESMLPGAAWSMSVNITQPRAIAGVYCSSHPAKIECSGAKHARVMVHSTHAASPGALRISVLTGRSSDSPGVAFYAYPDPDVSPRGGYFLMIAAAPPVPPGIETQKRDITLVIDRSGSMRGEKMEQARRAALNIINGLRDGEYFNIIDYSDSISSFSPRAMKKDRDTTAAALEYIAAMRPSGGTNIRDALIEALRADTVPGTLPIVLFMTDGLPTIGERDELRLRESVAAANIHSRRIFSFGVGADVNAPLLSNIADRSRGITTFVSPGEDVEVVMSRVFDRLDGPILTSPTITFVDTEGRHVHSAVSDVMPRDLPDLFAGDQLVIVGQYRTSDRITAQLSGLWLGRPANFTFTFSPSCATTRDAFVGRLWASRKIAWLVDAIRQSGASPESAADDPRLRELVDDIVRLSMKFGILTEYTAFLATEPGITPSRPMVPYSQARDEATDILESRAKRERLAAAGINQERNIAALKQQSTSPQNEYVDRDDKKVVITGVQRGEGSSVFARGDRWVDASLLAKEGLPPEEIVEFGTEAFTRVLNQIVAENRQAVLSRGGDVYLLIEGRRVLVKLSSWSAR